MKASIEDRCYCSCTPLFSRSFQEQEVGRLKEEVEALRVQCEELERQLLLADKSLEDSQRAR